MRRAALLIAFLSLACPAAAAQRDGVVDAAPNATWRSVATEDDRGRLRNWRDAWMAALAQVRAGENAAEIARGGALFEPDAALADPAPPPGDYDCRTVKLGTPQGDLLDYVAYPPFRCRIRREGGRLQLVKLTGSQRPVGALFPDNGRRMIFLGTLMLGDETRALRYGRDRERDLIGALERVGPGRWRIAFPYPHYESLLDVIELTLAPADKDDDAMRRKILAAMLLASVMTTAAPASAPAQELSQAIGRDMPELMALYRDLHANPELSMQETRSAGLMAAEARRAGFTVTTGVGVTGVVAVLENGPGPVLLLRADMDALPLEERTGLPFASRVRGTTREGQATGIMHACGHDTHMAAWVGTARRLAAMRSSWSGTLIMVAQPGEETSQGAKAMLEDGLFTRFPRPTHAIAFHDSATLPGGMIGYSDGPALANVDSVDMVVRGVGGHGAAPHTTRDPIVLASRIVTSLQTLVSRELDPLDSAVVTVGSFQAGTKHNIISDEARLQLTVRSYTPEVRRMLLTGIARIARGEAIAAGVPEDRMPVVTVREAEATPATVNTAALTDSTMARFRAHFGEERVRLTRPVMAGEDFGRFRLAAPGLESLIFWVGGVPQARWNAANGDMASLPSLHSPFWAPDAEAVVSTATEALVVAALGVLERR